VFGEGYQNNHHQYPHSANFGIRWFELDCGYWFCLLGERLGMFTLNKVIPDTPIARHNGTTTKCTSSISPDDKKY